MHYYKNPGEKVKINVDIKVLSRARSIQSLFRITHSSSSSSSSPSDREAQGRSWRYLSNHFSIIWVTRGWLRRRELFCMATNTPPSVTQQSSHSLNSFSCCSSFPFWEADKVLTLLLRNQHVCYLLDFLKAPPSISFTPEGGPVDGLIDSQGLDMVNKAQYSWLTEALINCGSSLPTHTRASLTCFRSQQE